MPVLLLIAFIDLVGFGVVIPLLPFYAEHFGAPPHVVTLLMAVYSFMQFLSAPILGTISDRYGRKPVIVLSLAGTVLAYIFAAFASSLAALFAARALAGLLAGNISAAQAYIADITAPEDRARGMGLFGAAVGLGFIFGPLIGGLLTGSDPANVDFRLPMLVAAGLSAVALVMAVVILRDPARRRDGAQGPRRPAWFRPIIAALSRPDLSLLVVIFFLVMLSFAGMESTFALWSERQLGWGPRQVGLLFTYLGVVAVIIQGGLIGRLTRAFGEERILLAGVGTLIAGFVTLPAATTLTATMIAAGLLAAGYALANPSLHSLLSRRAGGDVQGATLGVAQAAGSLSRCIAPALAGAVFSAWGRAWPYYVGTVLLLMACVGVWRLMRNGAVEAR